MSEQQSETTITVSGYGRKLCVLSEYVMRQAVCGYSAYGQRVLDAATPRVIVRVAGLTVRVV